MQVQSPGFEAGGAGGAVVTPPPPPPPPLAVVALFGWLQFLHTEREPKFKKPQGAQFQSPTFAGGAEGSAEDVADADVVAGVTMVVPLA